MAPSKAIPLFRRAASLQPRAPSLLIPCRRIANSSRIRTTESHAVSRASPPFYLRRCALSAHEMLSYPGFPLQTLASSRIARTSYSSAAAEAPASAASERPEPPDYLDEKEKAIFERLNSAFEPVALEVQDISGGCGSMYAVAITAEKFKGLPVIKQHRLVNEVLGEDIKSWHGLQLRTKTP